MCGRFTRMYTWQQLYELYQLTAAASNLQPRYNICPTTKIDAVVEKDGKRELLSARWGLVPSWWTKTIKDLKLATFNARVETVASKPFFRGPFKRSRCIIPMSGYYEWHTTDDGKQPYYFTAANGDPILSVAGLWDNWLDTETGSKINSCTMLITESNPWMADIHDRMPVLLQPEQFTPWLTGQAGLEMLKPASNDFLQRRAVSKRVNSSRTSDGDATLIAPI